MIKDINIPEVKNVTLAYIIAYPVFIVEMKDCRVNRFDQRGAVRRHRLKEMAEDGGVLLLAIFFSIPFA